MVRSRASRLVSLTVAGALFAAVPGPAQAEPTKLSIPFEKYKLANGLTVILNEDHTVPTVVVNLMVKVGSRFEAPHRTGFAHLFEHLMFMGTDRAPTGKFDEWMEAEGGSSNAWTSEDRTDFYESGPSHVLPLFLYLEADRLSSLGQTMTLEKLDAQRKVVKNERRQRSENTPYASLELRVPELLYPENHPYHHPVIGSHEDLEAATVDDVKSFFATYYVPNNIAFVVSGDFDPKTTKETIEKQLGSIPTAAAPPTPPQAPPVKLNGVIRETEEEENIQLVKIEMDFPSPSRFEPGDADLDLLANVLVHGKSSRLFKELVFDKQLAQSVSAGQNSQDIGSAFKIDVVLRPGTKPEEVEKLIDAELSKLAREKVTAEELERAKNDYETSFVERIESADERASLLSSYESFRGDPGYIQKDLDRYRAVTQESLLGYAKSVLDLKSRLIVRVVPKAKADRKEPGNKAAGTEKAQ